MLQRGIRMRRRVARSQSYMYIHIFLSIFAIIPPRPCVHEFWSKAERDINLRHKWIGLTHPSPNHANLQCSLFLSSPRPVTPRWEEKAAGMALTTTELERVETRRDATRVECYRKARRKWRDCARKLYWWTVIILPLKAKIKLKIRSCKGYHESAARARARVRAEKKEREKSLTNTIKIFRIEIFKPYEWYFPQNHMLMPPEAEYYVKAR